MKEIDESFFDKTNEIKKKNLEDYLEIGEKILWKGKPKKASYVLSKSFKLIPVATIWLIIDIAIISIIIGTGGIKEMWFFIIPFFALHLAPVWICIANVVKAGREIKNTTYAITNRRVICKSGMYSEKFLALDFDKITSINLKKDKFDKMLGCGDIYLSGVGNSFVFFDIHDSDFIKERLNKIVSSIDKRDDEFYTNYTICEHCGSYVENTNKKCPNCGASNPGFKGEK